ncbi:MAG: TlpA family protein disulfide reductase, partial [Acidobacteria bacterium]|nr:TlpA family protein disulfide reductase [Acidobacteriota bacterium]
HQSNPKSGLADFVSGVDVRAGLIRALLELDRIEEADKVFDEVYKFPLGEPRYLASKIALQKELAIALRDRGYLEKATDRAKAGYDLIEVTYRSALYKSSLPETARHDLFTLAALYVSIKERLGRKKEAEDFNKQVMRYDFRQEPTMRLFYETELSIARLIGNPAPELLVAQWLNGQSRSLSELRGKVVLLDFWAMWCSPCIAAFPRFREFQSKYGGSGFEIIGVTKFYGRSDQEDDLSRERELKSLEDYKRRYQLSYPLAISKMDDVTNDERFSVISLPTVILIDRRGNVRQVKRGIGGYNKLRREIGKLLDEKQS